jgi:hypothetical protein
MASIGVSEHLSRVLWCSLLMLAGCGAASGAFPEYVPGYGTTDLPASVDLRPGFADMGLQVRPQGARGTCSVFTMVGALEYAWAQHAGEGVPLSVEFLNWASNQAIGQDLDGGFFSDLWQGYEAFGVCDEVTLPYSQAFKPELQPGEAARGEAAQRQAADLHLHWIKRWDVNSGLANTEFVEIKRVLAAGWPVCGGFRWPIETHWADGLLEWAPTEGVRDGHSVLLVGYRDDPQQPGGGVFLFHNSGGGPANPCMSYEYARAYMNDAVWIEAGTSHNETDTGSGPKGDTGSRTADARRAATAPGVRGVELDTSLLNPMGPPVVGRNRRVSSNEQPKWNDANLDMNWLMPGDAVEMPLLEGPGVINHIWMTSHAGWANELNALVLRIYWDGSDKPGVEVPLGDFFAVGQGKPAVVSSIPVQVSPSGSLSCYWRMPFRKSARITVTNDNPDRSAGLYWMVDWVQVDSISANTPYFYAKFRREYPAQSGRDYLIADLVGRGFYIGTVYSLTLAQDGWFGEGDDYFYIDGEQVPSLQGTGSEDYFNDAWGFRERTTAWFGQPRYQGYSAGDSAVCYRWHLPDPVYFQQSLRFSLEHKGNRPDATDGFYLERPDFLSSVAFWYQLGEPKPFGELPPWHERRVPWEQHHLVRAFQQAKSTGDAKLQVQTTGFFGARPTLYWANETAGAALEFPFSVQEEGRYAVRLTAANAPGLGGFDIELDGTKVHFVDFDTQEESEADVLLGTHQFAAGEHTLTFRAADSVDRIGPLRVEMLRLLRLPPEAKRTVRTHNEAHFIRLGIGRAVYAYRLAYGKLPDSFETLVESGIMPERYTRDENGHPLAQRIEDGRFIVTSSGDPGWTHSWRGLDARR